MARGRPLRTSLQWTDAELPLGLAERALRFGACVGLDHPKRKELLGARGGVHPDVNAVDIIDLDNISDSSGAVYEPPGMQNDAVINANFKRVDRGGPIVGTIPVAKVL
jgi:hypothetical protein